MMTHEQILLILMRLIRMFDSGGGGLICPRNRCIICASVTYMQVYIVVI